MPGSLCFIQQEFNGTCKAQWILETDFGLACYFIDGQESKTTYSTQLKRITPNNGQAVIAKHLLYLGDLLDRHAEWGKILRQIAEFSGCPVRYQDLFQLGLGNALDLEQFFRLTVQHCNGIRPETSHDCLCRFRPNAFDQS